MGFLLGLMGVAFGVPVKAPGFLVGSWAPIAILAGDPGEGREGSNLNPRFPIRIAGCDHKGCQQQLHDANQLAGLQLGRNGAGGARCK